MNSCVIYCDPPYKDTDQYKINGEDGFNFNEFEEWISEQKYPCVVSSYKAPKGCTEVVAFRTRSLMAGASGSVVLEKLFVPNKYKEWYYENIDIEVV